VGSLVTLEKTDYDFSIVFYGEEIFMGLYFVSATYGKVRRL
jgi:hypothetical protein